MGNSSASPKKKKKKDYGNYYMSRKMGKNVIQRLLSLSYRKQHSKLCFSTAHLVDFLSAPSSGKNPWVRSGTETLFQKELHRKPQASSDGGEIKYKDHQSTINLSSPLFCL